MPEALHRPTSESSPPGGERDPSAMPITSTLPGPKIPEPSTGPPASPAVLPFLPVLPPCISSGENRQGGGSLATFFGGGFLYWKQSPVELHLHTESGMVEGS
ncbi:uncharacterized protein LOC129178766 [Dunckerocampus dactyliophorus]|uniref:uncharacterized protein LOC129178766 n=1 Tax=Dunckerocampus dactyliophorus TaxID=161453 RepID=UPI002406411B|nr:uncharacterized protein LOC129178766 [Dunckerocampus dactyliophorus]